MKIYLDIDDTLIHTDLFDMRPVSHLKEFLEHVVNNHDVYWLTTHCNGDATVPVSYLSRFVDDDVIPLIMRLKPTRWRVRKIEAINLDEDFMWFEDAPSPSEIEDLKEKGKLDSLVKPNLDENPDYLKEYLNI